MRPFDIYDINYIKSHESLNSNLIKRYYQDSVWKLFLSIISLFFMVTKDVLFKPFGFNRLKKSSFAFFGDTNNNIRSLAPVQSHMTNSYLYSKKLPYGLMALNTLRYIPDVFILYKKEKGYLRKSLASDFSSYCFSYSDMDFAPRILQKINPKACAFANDHGSRTRALFRAAQNMNIKTVYMQHASVNIHFPPLEYDYAFLDGMESLEKYLYKKPCNSKIFLSGASRFDFQNTISFSKTNLSENNKLRVGVAINSIDNEKKVIEFIKQIMSIGKYECIIRPHPSQNTYKWKNIAKIYNCKISSAKKENPFTFIANADVFIAAQTSFHLDVAVAGKESFHYNFTNTDISDHYGYLKNNLIMDITDKSYEEIKILLDNHINNLNKAELVRYYVANYGSNYWGKAAELIALTIEELTINNKCPDFWIEKEYKGYSYFELKDTNL